MRGILKKRKSGLAQGRLSEIYSLGGVGKVSGRRVKQPGKVHDLGVIKRKRRKGKKGEDIEEGKNEPRGNERETWVW